MTETPQKQIQSAQSSAKDPIAAWLAVFERTLAVPKDEARAICDELEDHLRARVDDLVITGATEQEATRRAVAELGETVDLAQRFRAASQSTAWGTARRNIMQIALISFAGVALAVSSWTAFTASPSAPAVVSVESEAIEALDPEDWAPRVNVAMTPDTRLEAAFASFGAQLDAGVLVRWTELGVHPTFTFDATMNLSQIPLQTAIEAVFEPTGEHTSGTRDVTFRLDEGLLEIGPATFFDVREAETREISIADLHFETEGDIDAADLVALIEQSVEPTWWNRPGVRYPPINAAGTLVVATAPERVHTQIEHLLDRLREEADVYRETIEARADHAAREQETEMEEIEAEIEILQRRFIDLSIAAERLNAELVRLGHWPQNRVGRDTAPTRQPESDDERWETYAEFTENNQRLEDIASRLDAYQAKRYLLIVGLPADRVNSIRNAIEQDMSRERRISR